MGEKLTSTDGRRWAFCSRYDIGDAADETRVYLRRWRIVMTPYCGLYLHQVFLPDEGRLLHNHPYWFIGLVLCGGYVEDRPDGEFTVRRWRWRLMRRTDFHAIRRLLRTPTWTLLITGRRRQDFAYLADQGLVRHKSLDADQKVAVLVGYRDPDTGVVHHDFNFNGNERTVYIHSGHEDEGEAL
jgi:hypothetical protein